MVCIQLLRCKIIAKTTKSDGTERERKPFDNKEKLEKVTKDVHEFKESNINQYVEPQKQNFAEIVKEVNKVQKKEKERSENLIVLGTQPDSSNVEARDKFFATVLATAPSIQINFDCERIGKPNPEGKQLLRIRCEAGKN